MRNNKKFETQQITVFETVGKLVVFINDVLK